MELAGAGEPVVTDVPGEGCEAGREEEEKDQNSHGSNHALVEMLPGVAEMTMGVDFLPGL